MKKYRCITFLIYIALSSQAQTLKLTGCVKDSKTNGALSFCSIAIKGTGKGAVTNEDGKFTIYANASDTLLLSYIGYETKILPLDNFSETILLNPETLQLEEVSIHPDEYKYQIFKLCRSKLIKDNKFRASKMYYAINTQADEEPIEALECYYNGYLKGCIVQSLKFKNGRVALSPVDNHYFLTLQSSFAIAKTNFLANNNDHPGNPFCYNDKDLKRVYRLEWGIRNNEYCTITFIPKTNSLGNFICEAWIDLKSFNLLKFKLFINNANVHPFLPLFDHDLISAVCIDMTETFRPLNGINLPDHINFNYHFIYTSVRDTSTKRNISTSGIISFYDYDNPFILPYFDYNDNFDDYKKMSMIPYNMDFWRDNNPVLLSERQKKDLGFIAQKGKLINYSEKNSGNNFLKEIGYDSLFSLPGSTFYVDYYTFWTPGVKLCLDGKLPQNVEYSNQKASLLLNDDLYHFEIQILLDLNCINDTCKCRSYTVFDGAKTYFHLKKDSFTDCILNIYFDIYEIERRELQDILDSENLTINQIDDLYKKYVKKAEFISIQFLNDVQLGRNFMAILHWNEYVKNILGDDNISYSRNKDINFLKDGLNVPDNESYNVIITPQRK